MVLHSLPPPALTKMHFYLPCHPCSFLRTKVTWRSLHWKISPRTWTRERNQSPCLARSSQRSLTPVLGALADLGSLAGDPVQNLAGRGPTLSLAGASLGSTLTEEPARPVAFISKQEASPLKRSRAGKGWDLSRQYLSGALCQRWLLECPPSSTSRLERQLSQDHVCSSLKGVTQSLFLSLL
jgi:hypothetical protein